MDCVVFNIIYATHSINFYSRGCYFQRISTRNVGRFSYARHRMGRGIPLLFLGLPALEEVGGSAPHPGRLYPWEDPVPIT